MEGYAEARKSIEACVKALTKCVDINPQQLSFIWEELNSLEMPEIDCRAPEDRPETVRVCFEKKWTVLLFMESEMKNLDHLSETLHTTHKSDILEALRRLKGLSRPIPESECVDRWVADRDAFPGEPA